MAETKEAKSPAQEKAVDGTNAIRPAGYLDEKEVAYDSKNTGPDGPADPEGGTPVAVVSHQYQFPPNPPVPEGLKDGEVHDPRRWRKEGKY